MVLVVLIGPRWLDAAYDQKMNAIAADWVNQVNAAAKELGMYQEFLYMNFAAQFQDPLASYGQANVQFMRTVAKKYDPTGVFQRLAPGGFKLSNDGWNGGW